MYTRIISNRDNRVSDNWYSAPAHAQHPGQGDSPAPSPKNSTSKRTGSGKRHCKGVRCGYWEEVLCI